MLSVCAEAQKRNKAPASLQVPCFLSSRKEGSCRWRERRRAALAFVSPLTTDLPQKARQTDLPGHPAGREARSFSSRTGDIGQTRAVGWDLMPCPPTAAIHEQPRVTGTRIPPASLRPRSRGWRPFGRLRVRIRHRSGRCSRIAGQSPRRNSRAYRASHWRT